MQFAELGLSEEILKAVDEAGYQLATPIQEKAIPWFLQGRDLIGIAQTGTGKTASFTLPMIDILSSGRAKARMPRSLILEPTRELAAQVAENFDKYGKYTRLTKALLIGGESFVDQQKALEKGADVLIATPGRLLDLFERGKILLTDVKIFVIDEADRMLDMGFIPDIETIASKLPFTRQTVLFSATMPKEIRRLAERFQSNPKQVEVAPPASPAANVHQSLCMVEKAAKREVLRGFLRAEDVKNAFIFCNRKRDVAVVAHSLKRHGFDAEELHGDLPQEKRTEVLEKFRRENVKLLVCSDVAARGIDISGVSHVFNFDVPTHADDYVHRIGRTGRAGNTGRAITLAQPDDGKYLSAIEKLIGREIERIQPVDGGPAASPSSVNDEQPAGEERSRRRPSRRNERSGRPEPRHEEPRPQAPKAPEPRAAEPREDRGHERREERPTRDRRRNREEADEHRSDARVFADDPAVPAFLLRSPFAGRRDETKDETEQNG
jgi:superfamily II DNA/RNA helicase